MNTHTILCQDIAKDVSPSKIEKAFHTNKIVSRILRKLEQESQQSRQGWASLMDWSDRVGNLSSLLPENMLVESAINQSLVDPFRGIKQAFPPKYDPKMKTLGEAILAMHLCSQSKYGNDHLNLMEILEDCRLIDSAEVKRFSFEILGQDKTPKEVMEDFILELEGGEMLGESKSVSVGNATLYQSKKEE